MRFEVPQFIEIEDKIIGPLTWKQFVYIGGGIGILVVFYLTLPLTLFILFGLPLGALAASLAFQKVNNRPFSAFLESSVNYFTRTKLYLWRKDTAQSIIQKDERAAPAAPQKHLEFTNKRSIHELSRKLDLNIPQE